MSSTVVRLHEIVVAARQIGPATPVTDAWLMLFGLQSQAYIWRKIGLLHVLVEAAAQEATRISPNQAKNTTYWQSKINSALAAAIKHNDSTWRVFHDQIDVHAVGYLSVQAEICKLRIHHLDLDREKIAKAILCLEEAIKELESSNLEIEVKLGLIRRLRAMANVLSDYNITGDEAIFDEFKVTLVDLASAKDQGKDVPSQSKIRECLSIIADLMSTADGATALTGPVTRLLGFIP